MPAPHLYASQKLTMTASVWLGQYDRSFVWSDVYLGKPTGVGAVLPSSNITCLTFEQYILNRIHQVGPATHQS